LETNAGTEGERESWARSPVSPVCAVGRHPCQALRAYARMGPPPPPSGTARHDERCARTRPCPRHTLPEFASPCHLLPLAAMYCHMLHTSSHESASGGDAALLRRPGLSRPRLEAVLSIHSRTRRSLLGLHGIVLHVALETGGPRWQGAYPSRGFECTYPYPAQSGDRSMSARCRSVTTPRLSPLPVLGPAEAGASPPMRGRGAKRQPCPNKRMRIHLYTVKQYRVSCLHVLII